MSEASSSGSAQPSPARSNPFNREMLMDERYYEPNLLDSDVTMGAARVESNDYEFEVDNWHLTNNNNAQGRMGLTRMEELQLAIDSCKEMILASEEHSEKRRKLVAKLVQLRLQQQELKDGPFSVSEEAKTICGHRFVLQEKSGRNPYCERCTGIIWRLVQPFYRCKACGYRTHDKCMNIVTRVCAGVRAKSVLRQQRVACGYELAIAPERGLAAQKYRCAECRAKLAFAKSREQEPRLCDYSGLYFCPSCHWNDEVVIPARVINNWDYTPQKVSRSTKQLLEILRHKPLINIEMLNPKLLDYLEELRVLKRMRNDILLMKCYFVCCREARKLRILWHLKKHQHFVEGAHMYSLNDLISLKDGSLLEEIAITMEIFSNHIQKDCECCKGNGFICELCDDKSVLFPFDDYAAICRNCCATFHRRCFEKNVSCPRCKRRRTRRLSESQSVDEPASNEANTNLPGDLTRSAAITVTAANPFEGTTDAYDDSRNPFS